MKQASNFFTMQIVKKPLSIALLAAITAIGTGCGTPNNNTSSSASDLLFGQNLFEMECASCHMANGQGAVGGGMGGDITGKTKSSIMNHITSVSVMNHLDYLNDEQLQSLEDFLKPTVTSSSAASSSSAPAALDGAALFVQYCGACHKGNGMGTGGVHDVTNHSATQIKREIQFVREMQSLSFLTDAQINAIAEALKP